jgi:N-methylhydantoinase A
VFSAVGLLCSPVQRDVVRSWVEPWDHVGIDAAAADLAEEAAALVAGFGARDDVTVSVTFDCRYAGQSHELRVERVDAFHAEHARRNGFARESEPVDVVALRATARRRAPLAPDDLPAVARAPVRGPAVVAEPDCTVWVPAGWCAAPGPLGEFVLRPEGEA